MIRILNGILLLLILSSAACSETVKRGSSAGNPALVPVALEFSGNSNANVSRLNFCVTGVSFAPSGGGAPSTQALSAGTTTISSSAATSLASASLAEGVYVGASVQLSSGCGGAGSVAWTNGGGTFQSGDAITLQFPTSFVISATTQTLVLGIEPFVGQLASTDSGAQAQANLEGVSGTISVSGAQAGINLEVPIEMLGNGLGSQTSAVLFSRTRTALDTAAYDGSVSYAFELVGTNSDTVARNVTLVDASGNTVAQISVPATGNPSWNPIRYATAFTPTAGATDYRIRLDGTTSASQLSVYEARIRVKQVGATQTKLYIPLTNGNSQLTFNTDTAAAAEDSTSSGTYGQPQPSWYSPWIKNSAAFSQLASGQPWTFEAVLSANSGGTAYASLFDASTSTQVSASELSTQSTTPTLLSLPFTDASTGFVDGDPMQVEIKETTDIGNMYRAGLWVTLTSLSHAELYYRMANGENIDAGVGAGDVSNYRALVELSAYTSATLYHQMNGDVAAAGVSCVISLFDNGATDVGQTGSVIPGSGLTLNSTTAVLQRSGPLSVNDGDRLTAYTSANTGSANCAIFGSYLVIAF